MKCAAITKRHSVPVNDGELGSDQGANLNARGEVGSGPFSGETHASMKQELAGCPITKHTQVGQLGWAFKACCRLLAVPCGFAHH